MTCHACSASALPRGPFGSLCTECWSRVLAVVERIIGKTSRWRG